MKRALIVAGVAGLSMFVAMGCEEKKANPLGDAMKQAGDKAKDATAGMADKAKDAASAGLKNLLDEKVGIRCPAQLHPFTRIQIIEKMKRCVAALGVVDFGRAGHGEP